MQKEWIITTTADRPDLVPAVARWLWHEFWRHDGYTLEQTQAVIAVSLARSGPSQTFVLLVLFRTASRSLGQQRCRAMVRRATSSRPTRNRTQDGLARHRATRRGAADCSRGNAAATADRGCTGPSRSDAMGRDAPASRPEAPRSDPPNPVPPQPGRPPRYSGTTSMPANV